MEQAMITENNRALLRGELAELPVFSHENHGRRFDTFVLEVERLSGVRDRVRVIAEERMMERLGLKEAAEANGGEDAIHVAVVNRYAGSILLERVTQSAANDPVHSVALLELNRLVLFADAGEDKPAHPGIDEVLTPFGSEEKALAMEKLLAETFSDETLLYYGPDPAMQKQADVGVAPRGAERAGCAWLDTDKPEALAWLILQGKKAKSVSWEGLMLVLGLKLVLLIGSLAGILPLWTAVLADSGMALLAACNALRLK